MPGLFAKYKSSQSLYTFDIRARLLVSLAVSGVVIVLDQALPLAILGGITFLYALSTRRFKLIGLAYLLVAVMSGISLVIIFGFYHGLESALVAAGSDHAEMASMMKQTLVGSFHIPFLRLIPSINVLLAIFMDFDLQAFIAGMKSVRLPRIIFLPLTVFCRFIPEFIKNIHHLHDAVRMRGFRITPVSLLIHPFLTLRLTIVPLSVSTLRMADNLAMAAEMKRIGYAKRPVMWNPPRFRLGDGILLIVAALVLTGLVIWQLNMPESAPMGGMQP